MEAFQLLVLGLLQGLTEFLPISSSAHLILLPNLASWKDQGLTYDIAVHVGSLLAVVIYFRRDLVKILNGWFASLRGNIESIEQKLMWYLVIATLPVGMFGLLGHDLIATHLRDPLIIAAATIFFGIMLWVADVVGKKTRTINQLQWQDIIIIGFAQAIALVPGTSRSGITITAGLMLGLDRQTASRFSFLLAIPVIFLAGAYEAYSIEIIDYANWASLLWVTVISFLSALLAIHFFLKLLDKTGMLPYVIYRVLLGIVLIVVYN